jgi:DNA-binding response OmpR family regulator
VNPDVAKHAPSILIVDNEQRNRDLLQIMLAAEGFQIRSAASAEEGLATIGQHAPDLVLLDVMMAGMDGYQMAAKIKGSRATRHIPIIMVTARDDQDGKMLGLLSGAENFLTKPVHRAELCLRARNLIRLKAHGDECRRHSETLQHELTVLTAQLAERSAALELQAAEVAEQAHCSTWRGTPSSCATATTVSSTGTTGPSSCSAGSAVRCSAGARWKS